MAPFGQRAVEDKPEDLMRTLLMAIVALAVCTGPSLAQDAAAGEQVFKR